MGFIFMLKPKIGRLYKRRRTSNFSSEALIPNIDFTQLYYSRQSRLRQLVALIFMAALVGCAPYTHERLLKKGDIDSITIGSGQFQHRIFRDTGVNPTSASNRLYIYIGGDGRPWRTPKHVASDPTSERAIMLESMLLGDPESVYVGRPCYYQVADSRCLGNWWTHDRYHSDVVNSLLKVVEQLAENHQELWLIGYSGGGTLAVLIGNRLSRPVNVVTVNANLDHQAWTDYHHYSPLTGSINPIQDSARNPDIKELHWYAREDKNILSEWILGYCHSRQALCLPISGSHSTGWPELWPDMLRCSQEVFQRASTANSGDAKREALCDNTA